MPSIASITPATFDSGRSVTLAGSGFGATQGQVLIAGLAQIVTAWSDTSITFTTVRGSQSLGACRVDVILATPGGVTAALYAAGWGQEITAGGTISGPAPFAVHFDATGSTGAVDNAFRELCYHFDFGYATPSTPGTWTHSSQAKGNEVGGPLSAHVFESPGTYTVGVRVQDADGAYDDAFLTVEVIDADTYWTTGGRSSTTITATTGAWGSFASNTRYILTAGADYTARGDIPASFHTLTNVFLGPTSGSDAIVNIAPAGVSCGGNIIFSRLDMRHSGDYIGVAGMGSEDVLVYKGTASKRYQSSDDNVRPFFPAQESSQRTTLYECTRSSGDYGFFGFSWGLAVLGCTFTGQSAHNIRGIPVKAFIAHNRLTGDEVDGVGHCVKFQGGGVDAPTLTHNEGGSDFYGWQAVIAHNDIDIDANSTNWGCAYHPENSNVGTIQKLVDIIHENNIHSSDSGNDYDVTANGVRITIRNNTKTGGGDISMSIGHNAPSMLAADKGPVYYDSGVTVTGNVYAEALPADFTINPSKPGT